MVPEEKEDEVRRTETRALSSTLYLSTGNDSRLVFKFNFRLAHQGVQLAVHGNLSEVLLQ